MIGEAKPHVMFMSGGDPLTPEIESLAVKPHHQIPEDGKSDLCLFTKKDWAGQ